MVASTSSVSLCGMTSVASWHYIDVSHDERLTRADTPGDCYIHCVLRFPGYPKDGGITARQLQFDPHRLPARQALRRISIGTASQTHDAVARAPRHAPRCRR